MKKVFIDGKAGTTGLRIYERLSERQDIEWIVLPEELRKDADARKKAMNDADIVFLCLPDSAAIEAVSMVENPDTVIIDTSTAHRTDDRFVYGFPELKGQAERIKNAKRIANPGCHASGFVALVAPLREAGILDEDVYLTAFSITGYSGGGKKMIADYEEGEINPLLKGPRQYALTQQHKHLKEMNAVCNLKKTPVFCPIVSDFYSGMEVTVPLFKKDIHGSIEDIKRIYKEYYTGKIVKFVENADEEGFLSATALESRDDMQITVCGNEDRVLLVARFDNLGKGASGSAIQNMNIILGIDETTGLVGGF